MRASLALAAIAGLALGCATGAKPEGMTPSGSVEPPLSVDAAALADLPTLTLRTTGGRDTNPLHTSRISNDAFTQAVAVEIFRSGAFVPVFDGVADYHLHIDLARIDRPYWGWLAMEVTIEADWRLYDLETGRLVWERRVESAFTATGDDAQWGIRRLRLAHEGSARHNIIDGVAALARVAPRAD